jgi:anaerobic selenocysteine-containing dehydrogenase
MLKNLEARFFNLLGGVTRPRGSLCWAAGIAAQEADFGAVFSHPPEDIFNAGCVVVWGKNPALTSVHSHRYLVQAKQRGIPVIVIDPVVSQTAAIADLHVQLRPGSDGWLALGLARILLDKGFADDKFIAEKTAGFSQYSNLLAAADLDTVTSYTGLARGQIEELADLLSSRKPVQFYLGYGLQRYHDSFNTVRHIDALGAIMGSIGARGGGVNYANLFWDDILDYEALTLKAEHRTFPKPELGKFLLETDIKMMVVARGNPLVQAPDTNSVRAGFRKVEYKVVLDLELTDTAREADLVLPCTSFLEEEDIFMSNMWQPVMNYAKPVLAPFGESKPEGNIYYLLAQRLGLDFPWLSPREWLERVLVPASKWGVTIEKLEQGSLGPDPKPPLPWSRDKFQTASGKFEFTATLPDRLELGEGELLLLTPHRGGTMHSQLFRDQDHHQLELAAATAKENQVAQGDMVWLRSASGQISVQVKISEQVSPEVGLIYQSGKCQGEVVNVLTDPRPTKEGDGAAYNQCICRIAKKD